jgi:hypothetical protein
MPLAPASSLAHRFPRALAEVLAAHEVPHAFIDAELVHMGHITYAKTASRSVLGVMNEFVFLAGVYRGNPTIRNLSDLSLRLAQTPCSPLYKGPVTPRQALKDLVDALAKRNRKH